MQPLSARERDAIEEEEAARLSAAGRRVALMWVLLIVGFYMVAFALPLGYQFAREYGGWSPDKARELAVAFRSVGFLLFASGLAERILIRLGK